VIFFAANIINTSRKIKECYNNDDMK